MFFKISKETVSIAQNLPCLENLLMTQSLTWVAKRLPYAPRDHVWVAVSPLTLLERDWEEYFLFPHLHPFLTL